ALFFCASRGGHTRFSRDWSSDVCSADLWVEDSVALDQLQGLSEGFATVDAEPGAGMAMPLDIEAIRSDPVQADERRVELFPAIILEAGAVPLKKAVAGSVPLALDIDRVVELGGTHDRQEPRLQHIGDEPFTGGGDVRLLRRFEPAH